MRIKPGRWTTRARGAGQAAVRPVVYALCLLGVAGCGRDEPAPPAPRQPAAKPALPSPAPVAMPPRRVLAERLGEALAPHAPDVKLRITDARDGRVILEITQAPPRVLETLRASGQPLLSAEIPEAKALQACLRRAVTTLQAQPGVLHVTIAPITPNTVAKQYVRLARMEVDRRRFDEAAKWLDRAEAVAPGRASDTPDWVPAVRHMRRTRARLQALAMGLLAYHDDHRRYPSGVVSGRSRIGQATWLCAVLPYVGAEDVYHSYNFQRNYAHRCNTTAAGRVVEAFLTPGHSVRRHRGGMGVTHVAGVLLEESDSRNRTFILSVLGRNTCVRVRDIRDGTGHTLLAGQVARLLPGWAEGARTLRDVDKGINTEPGRSFESHVPGGALFLFVDGHARFLSNDIDPSVLRALATYNGNETIDEDQY